MIPPKNPEDYPAFSVNDNGKTYPGLTKREYFTAMALQGIIACGNGWISVSDAQELARRAIASADATLAELEGKPKDTMPPSGLWLIWSNEHKQWWGPNRRGYTNNRLNAGRYSFKEALEICKGANENGETLNECMCPVW